MNDTKQNKNEISIVGEMNLFSKYQKRNLLNMKIKRREKNNRPMRSV